MSYVQSKSKDSGSVTSDTLAFTSNTTAGNTIVAGVRIGANGRTLTLSDSTSNTYNQTAAQNDAVGDDLIGGYAQNIAGGACTVTSAISGAAASMRWVIGEYGGLATASFDKTAGAVGSSTTPSSGNTATTTQANETLVGLIDAGDSQTGFTAGTSYTKREELIVGGSLKIGLEDRDVTSTGTYAADATLAGASGHWAAIILTLKASGGGGGFTAVERRTFGSVGRVGSRRAA